MNHLSGLVILSTIIECGSMSRAAQRLNMSRSAISKQLMRFESSLGARLIHRTTRKLSLTELGEQVWLEAQNVQNALNNVHSLTQNHQNKPHGILRVSCSSSIGRMHLLPHLPQFQQSYPEIALQLQLEDRLVDLIDEHVDVCIRAGHLTDSSLIAKRLGQMSWQLVASPVYLKKYGTPHTPNDLLQHNCLVYKNTKSTQDVWSFLDKQNTTHQVKVSGSLALNDGCALVNAACNHLGIIKTDYSLSHTQVRNGELIALLPDFKPESGFPVYAIYPARAYLPAKTTAFLQFLDQYFTPNLVKNIDDV